MNIYRYIAVICLVLASPLVAREIHYGTEKEVVTLAYGVATIFRFDTPVKTISQVTNFEIAPVDDQKPDYKTLQVLPRVISGVSDVSFILADESVVHLKLEVVPTSIPEKTDSFYDFKPKELHLDSEDKKRIVLSEIEVMKAMIRGDQINGYKLRRLIRTIRTGHKNLGAKLISIYTGVDFNGYIFKLTNYSKKTGFRVDLNQLQLGRPNTALLSQVDRPLLGSKKGENQTILRIVAKPSSVYYNIHLPIARIGKKERPNGTN